MPLTCEEHPQCGAIARKDRQRCFVSDPLVTSSNTLVTDHAAHDYMYDSLSS